MSRTPSHPPCWPAQNQLDVKPGLSDAVSIGTCSVLLCFLNRQTRSLHCHRLSIHVVCTSCCPKARCSSRKAATEMYSEHDKLNCCNDAHLCAFWPRARKLQEVGAPWERQYVHAGDPATCPHLYRREVHSDPQVIADQVANSVSCRPDLRESSCRM